MSFIDNELLPLDPGSRSSAAVVIPLLLERLGFSIGRAIDVGCGHGQWGNILQMYGWQVMGVDGPGADSELQKLPLVVRDLAQSGSLYGLGVFDFVICVEVAEHLPEARAETLVTELCELAPLVLWSAAEPGQGGTRHINCQPPEYWEDKFSRNYFRCKDWLRPLIKGDSRVEPWYRNNIMLYEVEKP